MSIALLEAMALGIPVVASSISGNQRLVDDFEHGQFVPETTPYPLPVRSSTSGKTWIAIQMGLAAAAVSSLNSRSKLCRETSYVVS